MHISGCREYSIQDDLTCGTMIGVVKAITREWEKVGGIAGDENSGFSLANHTDNFPAEFEAWEEVAILKIQEANRTNSNDPGGFFLFRVTGGTEFGRSEVQATAFIATG
jgi:hypothetical protein